MATVDELSVRIAADTADFQAGAEGVESQLGDLSSEAIQTAASLEILSNRADDAGDNISQAGRRATQTSAQFSALSGATSAANASFMGISATTWASLIPAFIALSAALAPVVGAMGGFVAVAGSIAAVGILPVIGAIATETERLKEQFTSVVDTLKSEFAPVFDLAADVLIGLMQQFEAIIPALVPAQDVLQRLAGNFAQLGAELINLLPAVVDLAIALTTEFLPPFVTWMQDILPQLPGMIRGLVRVLDRMLPRFMRAGRLMAELLPPFTEFGFTVLNVLGPALADLARIGTTVLTFFNRLDNRIQNAGASLALLLPVITTLASLLGGPVTLALGGVVAAVAGFATAFRTNFANVRTFLNRLWGDVQRVLPAIEGAFNAFVSGFDLAGVNAALGNLEETLGTQLMASLEALQPVLSDFITFFNENQQEFETIGAAASALTIKLINLASGIVNILVPAIRTVMIPALRTVVDVLDWMLAALTTNLKAFEQIQSGDFSGAADTVLSSDAPGEFGEIFMPENQGARQSINERIVEKVATVTVEDGEIVAKMDERANEALSREQRRTRERQGRNPTPR